MMGLMMDAFGWSAGQFWASTSQEVWALIEARQKANEGLNSR
jgi:hypothetical protein